MAGKPGQNDGTMEQDEHHNTELGHYNHVCNTWAPAIEKFELTGVGHLRRPKNAMDEGEDVLCCFFTSVGCSEMWRTTGWLGLPWGVGISGAERRERRFRPAL